MQATPSYNQATLSYTKLHLNVITKYQPTTQFNNKLIIFVSKPNYYHSTIHKTSILFLTNMLDVFLNYFTNLSSTKKP